MTRRPRRMLPAVALTCLVLGGLLAGCAPPAQATVTYLGAASGTSPREDGIATAALGSATEGASLLVAVATGDGPDHPADQHSVLDDSAGRRWSLAVHHVVFGSILDIYTAPGTGHDAGTTVSSHLTITRGDEGHALTVLAYRGGRLGPVTERNGHFGTAQLTADVPTGSDAVLAFGDGRQNAPVTLTPGFVPALSFPVDGGIGGDQDLYVVGHLARPGSSPGGPVQVGTTAPPASGYWGVVCAVVRPQN